jgi:hypothetical protein
MSSVSGLPVTESWSSTTGCETGHASYSLAEYVSTAVLLSRAFNRLVVGFVLFCQSLVALLVCDTWPAGIQ